MKISTRLSFSMIALLFLVTVLGVFSIQHGDVMSKSFAEVARMAHNRAMADTIVKNMSRVRANIWAGIAINNPDRWQKAEELLTAVQNQMAALEKSMLNNERKAMLSEMKSMIGEYLTVYPKVKALRLQGITIENENLKAAIAQGSKIGNRIDETGQELTVSYEKSFAKVTADYTNMTQEFIRISIGICILVIVISVGIGYTTFRHIAPPIKAMTLAMSALARGNLSVNIPATSNKDELGEMAKAVQVFKDNAIQMQAMKREREQLAAKAAAERKDALQKIAGQFEASVRDVEKIASSSATEMQATALNISAVAQQASDKAATVPAGDEMAAFLASISGQVAEAAKIAAMASEKAARTNEIVHILADAVDKISEVVILINDISSQTDMLALSATVEAEYAGDAGEGFSLVAHKVKSLATQTARATWEIGDQVRAAQDETDRAVEAMREVGSVIDNLRHISSTLASAVAKHGTSTQGKM